MTKRTWFATLAAVVAISAGMLSGCSVPTFVSEGDIHGTWAYEEGGTVTFDTDTIVVDDLYLSPLDGRGFGEHFDGSGTWNLTDKGYVRFKLSEWTQRSVPSAAGKTFSSSFKAVERDGELQLEIYDAAQDVRSYLSKE